MRFKDLEVTMQSNSVSSGSMWIRKKLLSHMFLLQLHDFSDDSEWGYSSSKCINQKQTNSIMHSSIEKLQFILNWNTESAVSLSGLLQHKVNGFGIAHLPPIPTPSDWSCRIPSLTYLYVEKVKQQLVSPQRTDTRAPPAGSYICENCSPILSFISCCTLPSQKL